MRSFLWLILAVTAEWKNWSLKFVDKNGETVEKSYKIQKFLQNPTKKIEFFMDFVIHPILILPMSLNFIP